MAGDSVDKSLSDALKGALTSKKTGAVKNYGKPEYDDDPIVEQNSQEPTTSKNTQKPKKSLTNKKDVIKVRKKRVGHSNVTVQFRLNGDANLRLENLLEKANAKGMDLDFKSTLNLIVYGVSKLSNKEFQDLIIKNRIDLNSESQ